MQNLNIHPINVSNAKAPIHSFHFHSLQKKQILYLLRTNEYDSLLPGAENFILEIRLLKLLSSVTYLIAVKRPKKKKKHLTRTLNTVCTSFSHSF